jgi:hypothetical protein
MGKFISRYITSAHSSKSLHLDEIYTVTANTNAARFLNSMLAHFTLDTVESLGGRFSSVEKKLLKGLHLRIQIYCLTL